MVTNCGLDDSLVDDILLLNSVTSTLMMKVLFFFWYILCGGGKLLDFSKHTRILVVLTGCSEYFYGHF